MLVVDEAAMVGTRTLGRLLAYAQTAEAKVVLVGDPCQLPEIEAGGTFTGLQDRLGASHLTDNRRQHNAWERATLAELRAGDPDRAFDDYLSRGRVHQAATDADVREQLVDVWMTARNDGDDVLMVAARLADVDDLNRRARYALWDESHLDDDQIVLGGRPFAEHDTVLALRNDYRLGLLNGTRATVERIDTSRHELTLTTTSGASLVVPFAYAAAGHLTHGYATTIHKAQGATVDRCYVLADDTLTRERSYTALSRGRHSNELFIVGDEHRLDEKHAHEVEPDPLDSVRYAMSRSAGKELAVDQIDPHVSTLVRLQAEREAIHVRIGLGPPDPGWRYREVCQQISRAESWLKGSRWRLDTARQALDGLGPIGRLTHRADRREYETRIERFEAEIIRHERELVELEHDRAGHEPAYRRHADWVKDRRDDLDRLDLLDHQIRTRELLDRTARRAVEHDVDQGLGIEP